MVLLHVLWLTTGLERKLAGEGLPILYKESSSDGISRLSKAFEQRRPCRRDSGRGVTESAVTVTFNGSLTLWQPLILMPNQVVSRTSGGVRAVNLLTGSPKWVTTWTDASRIVGAFWWS